jgi:hypothetical protein
MLTPSEYSRDTPELFVIKLTKLQFLTLTQRLTVLQWYQGYLCDLRTYYQTRSNYVLRAPDITEGERSWILRSIDYRLQPVNAELSWLDGQIADWQREQESGTA